MSNSVFIFLYNAAWVLSVLAAIVAWALKDKSIDKCKKLLTVSFCASVSVPVALTAMSVAAMSRSETPIRVIASFAFTSFLVHVALFAPASIVRLLLVGVMLSGRVGATSILLIICGICDAIWGNMMNDGLSHFA